jgi:hypothetical protein
MTFVVVVDGVVNEFVGVTSVVALAEVVTVAVSEKSKLMSLLVLSPWWISTAMTLLPATSRLELMLAE